MLYRVPPTQSLISTVEKVTENEETKIIVIFFKKVTREILLRISFNILGSKQTEELSERWHEGLENNICTYSTGLAK